MRRFIPFAIPSGSSPAVQTQTKSATITTNGGSVTVQPDSGFLLSSATVTANIPTEEKTQSITANGTYTLTPASGKLLSKATFSVNVPTGGGLPAEIAAMETGSFISSSEIDGETVHVFSPAIRPDIIVFYSSEVVTSNHTIVGGIITTYDGVSGSLKTKSAAGAFSPASPVVSKSGNNVTIKNASASRWRKALTYYYIIIQLDVIPTSAGDPPQTGTSEPGVML